LQTSILVPLNDSVSSQGLLDFIIQKLPLAPDATVFTLLHVFRKPTSGEELMGKKFMEEQPERFRSLLEDARNRLIEEKGFKPENIEITLLTEPYPSVTEGIIDYFNKGSFDIVVIGRKEMSKSEEFVLGDISVKLIRSLGKTSVLVVKSE